MFNLHLAISILKAFTCSVLITLCSAHCLYPRHLCRGVYSFRLSVRPFVCSFVVRTSVTFVEFASKFCVSSGVYLSNYLPESIHIWTIVTLED